LLFGVSIEYVMACGSFDRVPIAVAEGGHRPDSERCGSSILRRLSSGRRFDPSLYFPASIWSHWKRHRNIIRERTRL
jgi:hypothetical protein